MRPAGEPDGRADKEVVDVELAGLPSAQQIPVVPAMHGLGTTGPCSFVSGVSHVACGSRVRLSVRVGEMHEGSADDLLEVPPANGQRCLELVVVEPGEDLMVEGMEPDGHAGARQGLDVGATEMLGDVGALILDGLLQSRVALAGGDERLDPVTSRV